MMTATHRAVRTRGVPLIAVLALLLAGAAAFAADLSIYTDSLDSSWANWSWDTSTNFSATSPVHQGTASLAVTFTAGWAGLYLHTDSAIDLSGYDHLSFWINGGSTGNRQLRVVANGDGSSAYSVSAAAGTWTQVDIPLTALGSPSTLTALYWQDTTNGAQPTFYLDDIILIASTGPPPPPPGLSVNAALGRHPISDDIYGINFADETFAAEIQLPVRRWGGNSVTRYNWQTSMVNTGSDWYYENIPSGTVNVANLPNGSASDQFVDQDRRTGTRSLLTIPLIGWTAAGDSPRQHPYDCGFKVSKYGAQQYVDPWDTDCGNGVLASGTPITGNDATDTCDAITPAFATGWVQHLIGRYGTAAAGGVAYYNLDNEPMLWNSTHRDIHPDPASYDEMNTRTTQYAAAIKAADPTAKTLGPVLWGWCAYFYSARDGCGIGTDYQSHGNTYFVPWYLQQLWSYEQGHGTRLLDYLDLHYYPQANGVALSTAGGSGTQALRLRSTRSLWDPTYTDESWIGTTVQLIPRMKSWVNTSYPGTKLAITEYNWGGLEHINGALAQADVLGIFGREGLDLATLWGPPDATQPGAFAFRIYRNYDGAGSGFGDVSLQATSSDQSKLSIYAAQRSSDQAMTVVVINKTAGSLTSNVTLTGFTPPATAEVYQYSATNLAAIVQLTDQTLTAGGFSATFPGNSITLFVMAGGAPPPGSPPAGLKIR